MTRLQIHISDCAAGQIDGRTVFGSLGGFVVEGRGCEEIIWSVSSNSSIKDEAYKTLACSEEGSATETRKRESGD